MATPTPAPKAIPEVKELVEVAGTTAGQMSDAEKKKLEELQKLRKAKKDKK